MIWDVRLQRTAITLVLGSDLDAAGLRKTTIAWSLVPFYPVIRWDLCMLHHKMFMLSCNLENGPLIDLVFVFLLIIKNNWFCFWFWFFFSFLYDYDFMIHVCMIVLFKLFLNFVFVLIVLFFCLFLAPVPLSLCFVFSSSFTRCYFFYSVSSFFVSSFSFCFFKVNRWTMLPKQKENKEIFNSLHSQRVCPLSLFLLTPRLVRPC